MAKLIGEVLLQRDLIDETQLQEGLDAQLIYGGHLGTCLIELGFLEEGELGEALAESFGVKYAAPELLQQIPPDLIEIFSRELVEKHHTIPFGKTLSGLHIAMLNPRDLAALDEISFVSSNKVIPWVAPELRIVQAMERYYDTERKMRFVSLSRQLDKTRGEHLRDTGAAPGFSGGLPADGIQVVLEDREREEEAMLTTDSVRGSLAARPTAQGEAAPGIDDIIVHLSGTGPEVMQPTIFARDHEPGETGLPGAGENLPFDERLCRAETGEEVADLILESAAGSLPHCLFFLIKKNGEFVCSSRGIPLAPDPTTGLTPNAVLGQVFELLCENLNYWGPVPDVEAYQSFFNTLQMEFPRELIILPVYLRGRLFAVFYGDSGPSEKIAEPIEHYSKLMKKLALTLEVMLLKRKLRSI